MQRCVDGPAGCIPEDRRHLDRVGRHAACRDEAPRPVGCLMSGALHECVHGVGWGPCSICGPASQEVRTRNLGMPVFESLLPVKIPTATELLATLAGGDDVEILVSDGLGMTIAQAMKRTAIRNGYRVS